MLIVTIAASKLAIADEPAEDHEAAAGLRELSKVCERDGTLLWHKSLCGPMVLVNGSTRAAIANHQDPDNSFRKDGEVFVGTFPQQFTPSNTAIQWKEQSWSTVLLPLPLDPFQRLRSEEHTSELQSHLNLVCRLLLEKKKNIEEDATLVVSTKLARSI